ncbi:MAG: formylglycine-generating enzyme family protein [Bacteroidales bacterium]|jgi:formylglycine-generating enzyme required for sulfatase activity|nr:formylglycine-generating enzyme family protein [Bacteroidales bacterium]
MKEDPNVNTTNDENIFNIGKGNIKILEDKNSLIVFSKGNKKTFLPLSQEVIVCGKTKIYSIEINANVTVVLKDVTIDSSSYFSDRLSAIEIGALARKVRIILEGTSTIQSGKKPAIHITDGILTFESKTSSDSLSISSFYNGIGGKSNIKYREAWGRNGGSHWGEDMNATIIINGGQIQIKTNEGVSIGGGTGVGAEGSDGDEHRGPADGGDGHGGHSGEVIINHGSIYLSQGLGGGFGIGGEGGIWWAGMNGDTGTGYSGIPGKNIINGGSVRSTIKGKPTNAAGKELFLKEINIGVPNKLITASDLQDIVCDSENTPPVNGYGIKDIVSDDEGKVYLWLPEPANKNVAQTNQTITVNEAKFEMVYVQGGTFTMGCGSDDCCDDEKPAHQVTVSSFQIGKYPVTQAQWKAVMGSYPPDLFNTGCDECPVDNVSWNDVQEFIRKLNELTGKRYRLPTEAEWEYAARGGNQSRGYKYSGSNNIDKVAWYNYKNSIRGSDGTTHPVGKKKANELGIFDMSGNVLEWCGDWYGDNYTRDSQTNPKGPNSGSCRVLRGGGWYYDAEYCRVSYRYGSAPVARYNHYGFRLVLVP